MTLTLVSGCQSAKPGPEATVMTPTEAKVKLTALLDDTMAAVTPSLGFRDSWPDVTENDTPRGTANVSLDRFITTKVDPTKYGALLGLVERHWKARGYTIESVNADATMPAIFARASDQEAIHLTVGYPGNVTLTANVSPIKAPDPAASTDPFGPRPTEPTSANGNLDLLPTLDDPFWSH
ncbi:hypothetical protein ACFW1A_16650 [Kitasatospora sp. NPDC058965]|uniref:hypothetical protein n=1 Tax=Kitasatospora sp. NPDC058965 TaxID=3346682 RepID=UPI0036C02007